MKALTRATVYRIIGLARHEDDRTEMERAIGDLRREERAELLALVWLGRADPDGYQEDWNRLVVAADREWGVGADGASYMGDDHALADHLRSGLERLDPASAAELVKHMWPPMSSLSAFE